MPIVLDLLSIPLRAYFDKSPYFDILPEVDIFNMIFCICLFSQTVFFFGDIDLSFGCIGIDFYDACISTPLINMCTDSTEV